MRLARVLLAGALAGGCLSVPDEKPVECKVTSDCDTANGEVCEEGVCWGNPPPGPFAALIAPPTSRKDELVPHEQILQAIPADGYFGDLILEQAVVYSGQVVCPNECGTELLSASIEVTRPSTFPGGPGFRQVFSTDPRTGTFQLVLPPVHPGESDYAITITPDNRTADPATGQMANLVPPLRTSLSLVANQSGKTYDLGGTTLPITISGTIVDFQANPAADYRIVALGRWDSTSPLSEVSTVDFIRSTGGNAFTLRLSEGIQGDVEIVAQPFGSTPQPTLRLGKVDSTSVAENVQLVVPNLRTAGSSTVPVAVTVEGSKPGGGLTGVVGAHVTVTGSVSSSDNTATVLAEGDTNMLGEVTFMLPGGDFASTYKVSVVPLAGAAVGVVYDQPVEPGTPTKIKLPDRVAIAGIAVDIDGKPLEGVQVTAVPSLRFQWSLDGRSQKFITAIPSPTDVTLNTGEFVLHIDPSVLASDGGEVYGYYDLVFAPTEGSSAPTWTVFDVEVPRTSMLSQVVLDPIVLPDAAHIHGRIVDPFGDVIEAAELKLFRIQDPQAVSGACTELPHAPSSCPIPAYLMGRGVTDTDGIARLTLPR